MRKSRFLYLHEETNVGKLASLEALAVEYRRYLQSCVDTMIASRRFSIPKAELKRFFPIESILNTNIVIACQQHAVSIVLGWASSKYTQKTRSMVSHLKREREVSPDRAKELYSIGKHNIDRASRTISQEAVDQYWDLLLSTTKTPTVSDRVGIMFNKNTCEIKDSGLTLSGWWFNFSTLTRFERVEVPLKANPYVTKRSQIRAGCLVRKDKRGRWRVEVLETEVYQEPPKPDLEAPRVGIDVGLNVIAATSDGRLYGADQKPKFDALKFKVDQLRANRQRQGLKENSKRLDVLEDRLSGFIKTLTGAVANKLVKAYENHTFVLEDLNLSGCRGSKRFAYRALATSLARKTPCLVVNPAYTSQQCPSCGYVSRSNRSGVKFHCRGCGRLSHADVVGARNLLGRSEDKEISCDDLPHQLKSVLRRRYLLRRSSPVESIRSNRDPSLDPGSYCELVPSQDGPRIDPNA